MYYNINKLREALKQHAYYLQTGDTSKRAYLRDSDLRNADLRDADLSDADLSGADLSGADLRGAYLNGARLLINIDPAEAPNG